ncbi:hypothetical protein FKM82_010804 [Ascaphus truei]
MCSRESLSYQWGLPTGALSLFPEAWSPTWIRAQYLQRPSWLWAKLFEVEAVPILEEKWLDALKDTLGSPRHRTAPLDPRVTFRL